MAVRTVDEFEFNFLADLWYKGWQARCARADRARRIDSTSDVRKLPPKARGSHCDVRVVGPISEPAGFCLIKDDEVNQLNVAARDRGTDMAARLLADGEERIRDGRSKTAWLACAIGNKRAARFYEKNGWQRTEKVVIHLDIPTGKFPFEVWRYEKDL